MHEYRRKRLIKKPRISSYCIIAIIIFQKISPFQPKCRSIDRRGKASRIKSRRICAQQLVEKSFLAKNIIKKYFGSFARTNERCNTGQTKRFKVRLLTIPNTLDAIDTLMKTPLYFHFIFTSPLFRPFLIPLH